jgi:hypothetical protein
MCPHTMISPEHPERALSQEAEEFQSQRETTWDNLSPTPEKGAFSFVSLSPSSGKFRQSLSLSPARVPISPDLDIWTDLESAATAAAVKDAVLPLQEHVARGSGGGRRGGSAHDACSKTELSADAHTAAAGRALPL